MNVDTRCETRESSRSRGRPKVLPDEARREHLTEVALGLFAEIGYARTTMDLVAERAKVSKQTLYRFFPGKSALFAAVITWHRQLLLALPGDYDDLPLDEAIARIFHADLDSATYRRNMVLIETLLGESSTNPEIIEILTRHGAAPARADLATWLRHEMARGRIRPAADVEILADILIHTIFGVFKSGSAHCGPTWPNTPDRAILVRRCIDVFLNGVASPRT